MSTPEITVLRAQLWASRVERSRRFLVTNATDADARGMDYREGESRTSILTLPIADLKARYQLLEDVPAHWGQVTCDR